VIKSQTKAKKRSLEWEQSRSPQTRVTTRHNRDKMLQNCWLLKVRQKGSTPSANEKTKIEKKRAPKCMNASSPLNKCISPNFSYLDVKTPPGNMNWVLPPPLLVIHESSLQMQACASQIYKEHRSMPKLRQTSKIATMWAQALPTRYKGTYKQVIQPWSKWSIFTKNPSHEYRT
jgi:hypothetical protein